MSESEPAFSVWRSLVTMPDPDPDPDPTSAFSTPFDAPLVPRFPIEFRNVNILTTIYGTDRAAIRELLPAPLDPVDDEVMIHLYQMNDTDHFGAYNESAVQVRSVLPATGDRGVYSPYLFLDHDGAIAAGRETYGQPKKFGRPSIEIRQDLIVGSVTRNDIEIVTVTVPYKSSRIIATDLLDRLDCIVNINLKIIPDVDGKDAIRQLTARSLLDVRIHECWDGPATVEIRPNAQAPLYRLPVREMRGGFYWNCDFTLGTGRVIHDYLSAANVGSRRKGLASG